MKYILVLFAALTFTGCTNVLFDMGYADKASGHTLYNHPDFKNITSIQDAGRWVNSHMCYDAGSDDIKSWSNPKDTLDRGYGTCVDGTLLMMNVLYYSMGVKAQLVILDSSTRSRSIENGGMTSNHAAIRIGNQVYEYNGVAIKCVVDYYYSFDEVFN